MRIWLGAALLPAMTLGGCEMHEAVGDSPFEPVYAGIETRLLEGDLVNFHVEMIGARDRQDVADYAECAAAQYALIRGYGFARHVRTNTREEGGLWRGDAVYTISSSLPDGLKTIDAEVVVANCTKTAFRLCEGPWQNSLLLRLELASRSSRSASRCWAL